MAVESVEQLVAAARTDDMEAFGRLVRRFQDMACGYAYALLGDFHLAEDAAQEAFIDAYRRLDEVRVPQAFPGWFRRVVYKHCDRQRRGQRLTGLECPEEVPADAAGPLQLLEAQERKRQIRQAINDLPPHQRQVTTLFYLQSYSQNEIAAFLEVPLTTVKKRLHDARARLKERMLEMVSDALKDNKPDERFSEQVIRELLERPRPLEIDGHPVRKIWDIVQGLLAEYEIVNGAEVADKRIYPSVDAAMGVSDQAYHMDGERILRTHTTHTAFQALNGRLPPVRLLTAGRAFRPDVEDDRRSRVFHQFDAVCIEAGADLDALKRVGEGLLKGVLGEAVTCRWVTHDFGFVDAGMELEVKWEGRSSWLAAGGGGLLKPAMLAEAGYDTMVVSGFALGLGLDRLAMIKYGIPSIRQLWSAPYIPA